MRRLVCLNLLLLTLPAAAFTPLVNVGGRQVTVTWQTPGFASSTEVAWGPDPAASFSAYPNHSGFSAAISTSHSRTLRRLPPGTYHYRARSTDGTTPQDSAEGSFVVPRAEGFPLGDVAFDNPILAITKTASTWYVGGYFNNAGPESGSGILVDASTGQRVESDFPEVNAEIVAVVPDGAGGLYLGGGFTSVGGFARSGAAHLLPDHGVDPDFNPSFSDRVTSLALSGGILYAGGQFTQVNGVSRHYAAAVDATRGGLTAWNPDLNNFVAALAVVGGSVWVGGSFTSANGGALIRNSAAAFDLTSGSATAFNPNFNAQVRVVTTDGTRLFYGGDFTTTGATTRNRAASFAVSNGALDAWDPSFDGPVFSLSYLGGTLYVGGTFFHVNGSTLRAYAAAVDPGTGTANGFNPILNGPLTAFAMLGPGTVYAVGGFSVPGRNAAAFDATTGSPVSPWDPQPSGRTNQLAVVGNALYLGGDFSSVGAPTPRANAAAIDATTGALTAWNPAPDGVVFSLQSSGNEIFLGGSFTHLSGVARDRLASVDGTTGSASAWDPGLDGVPDALLVLPDAVYTCGQFLNVNGSVPRMRAAAFDRATGLATPWAPELDGECFALASMGNVVYLGGAFTHSGATSRNFGAAMDTSGTLTAWDPNASAAIAAITVAGGRIVVGGYFNTINGGLGRPSVASLDAAAGTANAFTINTSGGATVALATAGNTLYMAGPFGQVQGQLRAYFAAVSLADATLLPFTADADAKVRALYPDCGGGGLALAGDFLGTNLSAQQSLSITEDPASCLSSVSTSQASSPDAGSPDAGVSDAASDEPPPGSEGPRRSHLILGWACSSPGATWSALALLPLVAWLARRRTR